jgi:phosphoglycerol transferase MdoB-like AlkP superfamily enzyme
MLGRIKFLLLYYLAWLGFFEIARLVFLLYHFTKTKELSFGTAAATFWYGLRMDLSIAAYFLLPVCLFVLAGLFFAFFRRALIYKIYTWIILFFVLLLTISDLELFSEWGFRIDATPLKYLGSPKEAWASISHLPVFLYLAIFIVVYVLMGFAFSQFIKRINSNQQSASNKIGTTAVVLLFTGLLIIPIRGGLQLAPLNQSSVYFSTNNFANQASVNATWNFVYGVLQETDESGNPYNYLPEENAKKIVDSLYASSGKFEQLVKGNKPNVILIVWESFTKKALDTIWEGKEVVPRFKELTREGIYFDNIYASGDRTDKGLAAIMSGYPALPKTSIIRVPSKSGKLSVLTKLFKEQGYATPFYYGGEPEFANIKSYLLQAGFDPITSVDDFNSADRNSKWGIHDGVVMKRISQDLTKIKQPFFAGWLTLSSHEPFEVPVPSLFKGEDVTSKFLNSLHYTDETIYQFVQSCKQQGWWNNTVMIIIADHGHPLPERSRKADNFQIPMLWLGGALLKRDTVVNTLGSQIDLAATFSAQAGFTKNNFPFSKNILDSSVHQWGFFTFNDGFGFVQPGARLIFDNVGRRVSEQDGTAGPKETEAGKALMQWTFRDYDHK